MNPMKIPIRFFFFCLVLYNPMAVVYADSLAYEFITASAETYAKPHDIVLSSDGKFLYVSDNGNNRIAILDSISLKLLGTFGKGEVSAPHDVDVDTQGRLLVADTGNNRIAIYAIEGLIGRLIGDLHEGVRRPEGVAAHSDGRIFVTGAASDNLVVYRDGKVIAERKGFSSSHDVAIDPAGGIWVADAGKDRMVRLNDALDITAIYSGSHYDFDGPRYMDFDNAGRMVVADKNNHRVKVISPEGKLLHVLGKAKPGKGLGVFDRPEGVAIRDKDIWFSDTYNDRIVRYRVIK